MTMARDTDRKIISEAVRLRIRSTGDTWMVYGDDRVTISKEDGQELIAIYSPRGRLTHVVHWAADPASKLGSRSVVEVNKRQFVLDVIEGKH
jgi:hypothetical protein